jgi:hypothetical protein
VVLDEIVGQWTAMAALPRVACPGLLPARGIVGLLLTLRFTFPGVL